LLLEGKELYKSTIGVLATNQEIELVTSHQSHMIDGGVRSLEEVVGNFQRSSGNAGPAISEVCERIELTDKLSYNHIATNLIRTHYASLRDLIILIARTKGSLWH
jgi:hypothetical protein